MIKQTRKLEGNIARDQPSGFLFADKVNPKLVSNNLLVPYVIAVWEEYFRATARWCLSIRLTDDLY
jgi:hypothetical protein